MTPGYRFRVWRLFGSGWGGTNFSAVLPLAQRCFHLGRLGWNCTSHSILACNLGVLLDSQLLLEKEVAVLARTVFAKVHFVGQLHLVLSSPSESHYCPGLLQSTAHELLLKTIWNLQLEPLQNTTSAVMGPSRSSHASLLLC